MEGKTIWELDLQERDFPTINKDIKTKVLIIGGGIVGILCAYELKKRNIEYILLEKDIVGNGTTKDTTAFVTVQHETLYQDLEKEKGITFAKEYLNINLKALRKYKELSQIFNFDYEECPSTIYSSMSEDIIRKEKETLDKLEYQTQLVNKVPIDKSCKLGITFPNQAIINPIKLINELSKDLNIYEHSEVETIKKDYVILTNKNKVFFEKVIIATNYPIKNIPRFYFMKLTQRKSYVAATAYDNIIGTYCSIDENGLYFRSYKNKLIIGGNDRDTKEEMKDNFFEKIKNKFNKKELEFMWYGQDCISLDGVPYIGRFNRFNNNYYVATGFNLWGFTWAMASSFIIADLIENKTTYDIVKPTRNIINKKLFINIGSSIRHLVTFKKPRCTHMGCALNYNDIDKVWECPCHGSMFGNKGKLIKGPAKKDIKITEKKENA